MFVFAASAVRFMVVLSAVSCGRLYPQGVRHVVTTPKKHGLSALS